MTKTKAEPFERRRFLRGMTTEPEWAAPDLAKSLDGYNCQDIKPLYFGIPNLYGTFEVKRLYLS
jgi:hypothetical protein